jgi:hypothetical protein
MTPTPNHALPHPHQSQQQLQQLQHHQQQIQQQNLLRQQQQGHTTPVQYPSHSQTQSSNPNQQQFQRPLGLPQSYTPQQQQQQQQIPPQVMLMRHIMADHFRNHPISQADVASVNGKPVDLTRLLKEVYDSGGFEKVRFLFFTPRFS